MQQLSNQHWEQQKELTTVKQGVNQTFQSLGAEICALVWKAYPEVGRYVHERIACEYFYGAILDPQIRISVTVESTIITAALAGVHLQY